MRTITIPPFGTLLPQYGGHFGAIMRGAAADGSQDYVLIVPAAEGAEIEAIAWAPEYIDVPGAASLTDGLANTTAMAAAGLELGKRIQALELHGFSDWHIPAAAELRALSATVPELFDKSDWYWSSTQSSRHGAFIQDFEYGYSYDDGKGSEYRVRPVRSIHLDHFTP